jgi:hypothetical protein
MCLMPGPSLTYRPCFPLAFLDQARQMVRGQRLTQKDGLDTAMAPHGPRNFEMKWAGSDGVVLDVSHTGWDIG